MLRSCQHRPAFAALPRARRASRWPRLRPARDAAVIPFTPDRWTLSEGINVVEHRGAQAIEIPRLPTRPEAVLKGLGVHQRHDRSRRGRHRPGSGRQSASIAATRGTYELFYVRPNPDCATKPDCVQSRAGHEERAALGHLPGAAGGGALPAGQWNHVKLVVSGRRLRVWVNGGAPALDVTRLEGDAHDGRDRAAGRRLAGQREGDAGRGRRARSPVLVPIRPRRTPRYVRNWMVSPVSALAEGRSPDFATLPAAKSELDLAAGAKPAAW